jgi:tetratricopeptide (TPR) repeat protein
MFTPDREIILWRSVLRFPISGFKKQAIGMSQDPYSVCPCGSGRKLKFCCGDILTDLIRIQRLEENQPEAAEKQLRDLLAKFPNREVIVAELTMLLCQSGNYADAKELVTAFLKRNPDHPRGLVLLSRIALVTEGYEGSRRLLHRTFQISSRTYPLEIAELAVAIGVYMVAAHEYMGGREHIALGARLAGPERGRKYLMNLAMLEADAVIPGVLRTPHMLLPVTGDSEFMQHDQRARKLSSIGCWEPAAILYSRMTETHPDNGAVWHNLGLCRAWDGRSSEAAGALHQAATLLSDFDVAAETEALAQILDQRLPDRQYKLVRYDFPVQSGSQLLTVLDDAPVFLRYPDEGSDEDEGESTIPAGMQRVAMYDQLQRPPQPGPVTDVSQLSEVVADLEVLDLVDETQAGVSGIRTPILRVSVVEDQANDVLQQLRSVCGDLLLPAEGGQPEPAVVVLQPRDAREFDIRLHMPDSMSKSQFRDLLRGANDQLAEKWMHRPVLALGGRTPLQAATDPGSRVALAGAVLALSVNARYFDRVFSESLLRQKLSLPEPAASHIPSGQHCAAYPYFFLHRLDVAALDEQQLLEYCNRVSMLGLADLARKGLDELLRRPEALAGFGTVRACLMRAAIARTENDLQTLSACLQQAREAASHSRESFREVLEIEIRELAMRLDDPSDPELVGLLHRIRDRYIAKLPEIGEVIQAQLLASNCAHLIAELDTTMAVTGAVSGTALWTPQSGSEAATGSGGALWLPGQD